MSRLVAQSLVVSAHGVDRPHGVEFDLSSGEGLAVVGASGSGKSTLARGLVGLHDLRGSMVLEIEGEAPITLAREDGPCPASAWARARRALRLGWQDPSAALDPRMSIRRTVALSRGLSGLPSAWDELDDVAVEVGLEPECLDRPPRALSGGQCQRAALLAALAAEPAILILDEPTVSLDRPRAWSLHAFLCARKQAGLALILMTHDLAWLRGLADRTLVLDQGEIVDSGETRALLESPNHAVTRRLVDAIPRMLEDSESAPATPASQLE